MSQTPGQSLQNSGANFVTDKHKDTYPYITPTNFGLRGRYVLITGASKGIGRATALSFAKAGAAGIALGARSSLTSLVPEIQAAATSARHKEPEILSLALDVTDEQSVAAAAKTARETFGKLDILVNNAGYLEPFVPLVESEPGQWWASWEVNIKGVYLVTRAFVPLMLGTPEGLRNVVNVSSLGAHRIDHGSAYRASKLALLRLTEFMDFEHRSEGLTAIAIHPGSVPTELAWGMPEEFAKQVLTDTPELGADTIVYLTAKNRDWLSGRYVSVQWDMEELETKKDEILRGDLLKVRMAVAMPH